MLALRDAIPPLTSPRYETALASDWLPDDLVVGYEASDGQAFAFPAKILNFHEIVNDDLGGEPLLVSYCPLCRSGIVYDRRLEGRVLTFGNTSALYESDLVMYDQQTLSYWFQVGGEAIVGSLTGTRLKVMPSVTTMWAGWLALHPDTRALSRDTGYRRDYSRDPSIGIETMLNAGSFPFPVTDAVEDDRLAPAELVLGVEVGDQARAYPIARLGDAAINDRLGGERIVILARALGPIVAAYSAEAGGRSLTFEARDGVYRDAETGSEWSVAGEAVAGPFEGSRLRPLPVRTAFWFSYVSAFPTADVYDAAR